MSDKALLMLLYQFTTPAARGLWLELARRLVSRGAIIGLLLEKK